MKLIFAFLSLVAAASAFGGEGGVPGYLPADTKVVIGMNVRGVTASALTRNIPAELSGVQADWTKLASLMGFDPFRDLDHVIIATNAKGQNAPALIVAHGRFGSVNLGANVTTYQGVRISQSKGTKDGAIALLDDSTALLGDPALVRRAIERRHAPSQVDPALMAIVNSLRVSYDVWGYGSVPPGVVPAAAKSQGLDAIDRFQFGIRLKNGLDLEANLHMRSSEDGEKLVATARMLESMVKMQQPEAEAGKLNIQTENGSVKISLSVPEQVLLQAMNSRMKAGNKSHGAGAAAVPSATPSNGASGGVTITSTEPVIQTAPNGDTMIVTLPGRK